MPMSPPAGAATGAGGVGISVTRLSVVRTMDATLDAFSSALRQTLVGSMIPSWIMLPYLSLIHISEPTRP